MASLWVWGILTIADRIISVAVLDMLGLIELSSVDAAKHELPFVLSSCSSSTGPFVVYLTIPSISCLGACLRRLLLTGEMERLWSLVKSGWFVVIVSIGSADEACDIGWLRNLWGITTGGGSCGWIDWDGVLDFLIVGFGSDSGVGGNCPGIVLLLINGIGLSGF